ncbi:hypothetical protein OHR68_00050 [Spirillospora sp. NBC_00431]
MAEVPDERDAGDPRGVLRKLEVLCEWAEDAKSTVGAGAQALTLPDTTSALESMTQILDAVHTVVESLNGRVAQIREREMTERRGDAGLGVSDASGLMALDDATVHVDRGCEALMVGLHLVGVGLGVVVRVERGEC